MKTERTSAIDTQSSDVELVRYMYPKLVQSGVMENRALVAELMTMKKLAEWESDLD